MRKVFYLIVAASLICGSAMAQEKKEKKSGGFLKALKKGVESTTGLRVSDEALFVYPTIGEWTMKVESCQGDSDTGAVTLKINVTKLTGTAPMGTWCNLKEAKVTGSSELTLHRRSVDPLYDFAINKPVEVTFQTILDVPVDTKTIDVGFEIIAQFFEARRIPIEWISAE